MIIIPDIHVKNKEPFKTAIIDFFDWLIKNFKNEIFVLLGDLFDNSSPHNSIEAEIVSKLIQLKEVHILTGNHDISYRAGNTLLHLQYHKNIKIYIEKTEIEIEGMKCLILPYKFDTSEYENINWKGDFAFMHLTPIEEQFVNEGVKLENIDAYQIYGHIHTFNEYKNKLICGVPIPTRNLEINNKIVKIDQNKKVEFIEHPIWFEYETIEFGKFPINKNNVLNIKNATSISAIYETYKNYNIREEGIELKININKNDKNIELGFNSIQDKFIEFIEKENIDDELKNVCLSYL